MNDAKNAPVKVTYATMSAGQMEGLHLAMEQAASEVAAGFGQSHPMFIGGKAVQGTGEFEDRSPIDTRVVLGRFQKGTRDQVKEAIAAARAAQPGWAARSWEERVGLVRKVGEAIRSERWQLAAIIQHEAGKSRLEAVGEVEESVDFFEYTRT